LSQLPKRYIAIAGFSLPFSPPCIIRQLSFLGFSKRSFRVFLTFPPTWFPLYLWLFSSLLLSALFPRWKRQERGSRTEARLPQTTLLPPISAPSLTLRSPVSSFLRFSTRASVLSAWHVNSLPPRTLFCYRIFPTTKELFRRPLLLIPPVIHSNHPRFLFPPRYARRFLVSLPSFQMLFGAYSPGAFSCRCLAAAISPFLPFFIVAQAGGPFKFFFSAADSLSVVRPPLGISFQPFVMLQVV